MPWGDGVTGGSQRVDALRRVLVAIPDRLDRETVTRASAELDRGDDLSASEILLAALDAARPTITWGEMGVLHEAMINYNNRDLDELRHPKLWWRHYILDDLPIISRGDGDERPMSISEFHKTMKWVLDALANRLDPVTNEYADSFFSHGEEALALATLAADLELESPPVTRPEWEKLRRLLLYYDLDEYDEAYGALHRGEEILSALPVIDP